MLTETRLSLTAQSRCKINQILSRALAEAGFRNALLADASEALRSSALSHEELRAIRDLRSDILEENGIDVRPYRKFLRTDGKKWRG